MILLQYYSMIQLTGGQTPLHYAVKKNIVLNVDWLLFVGADPDIKDKVMWSDWYRKEGKLTKSEEYLDILISIEILQLEFFKIV